MLTLYTPRDSSEGMKINRAVLIILLLSLFLGSFGIWWGLPNYFSWSNDDISPLLPLRAAYNRFIGVYKHPPLHYFITDLFYAPYIAYLSFTGELSALNKVFPYGLADPLTSLTVLMVISRILSVIMGTGIVFLVYLTSKKYMEKRG